VFRYEELLVKEKKGRVSLIAGLVCLVGALLLGSVSALPLLGVNHTLLATLHRILSNLFSFSAQPTRFGLVPVAFLLLVWTIMIFSFRGKKRFSFLLIPVTALMAYTLYTLSHMMQGSSRPLFVPMLLTSSEDVRSASFKVLLAFLGETALFVAVTLIGDALDRYHQHKAERQRLREELRLQQLAPVPKKEKPSRKQKKSEKRQMKQKEEEREEQENVTLSKNRLHRCRWRRATPFLNRRKFSFRRLQTCLPWKAFRARLPLPCMYRKRMSLRLRKSRSTGRSASVPCIP
jgi:S-DNA-T family DNA segregation ATPase FtsK/SpoIIIE